MNKKIYIIFIHTIDGDSLAWGRSNEEREEWMYSKQILMFELTGFSDGLNMGVEGEREGENDVLSLGFSLNDCWHF